MHKMMVFCIWTVKKLSKVKRTVTIISVQQVFKNNQRSIKLNHRTTMKVKVKANVPQVENATQKAVKKKRFHFLTDYSGFPYRNRKKCFHSVSIVNFQGHFVFNFFFTLSLIIYIIKHNFPFIYCIYVPTKVSRGDRH